MTVLGVWGIGLPAGGLRSPTALTEKCVLVGKDGLCLPFNLHELELSIEMNFCGLLPEAFFHEGRGSG